MKKLWHILILLTVVLVGCNKTDDLWDEVHDLQKRLTKLEVQVNNLNGNIIALQELYKNGATISKVEEANGTYTITLSNGKVLKVVQKMEETIYPMVGIDANGYWTVQYGEETPQQILVGGKPVKAIGDDGLTPEFRINEDTGYWEVRYKETDQFVTVKDSSGNPVKAEASTNTGFFKSAGTSADGKSFDLTLNNDTEISIPIVSSFSCTFKDIAEGVQKFNSEETKTFTVVLNGVDNLALMAVPTGWVAELSEAANNEATLTVTAPKVVAETTRATASNSSDISILANSGKFSTILKMQVEAIAAQPEQDHETMFKAGTLKIGDLEIKPDTYTAVTLDATDTDVEVTNSMLNPTNATVYFLKGSHNFNTNNSSVPVSGSNVIFISKSLKDKSNFCLNSYFQLSEEATLGFKNINITSDKNSNFTATYLFNNNGSTKNIQALLIEDCDIKGLSKSIISLTTTTSSINNLHFKNNYVEFGAFANNGAIFSMKGIDKGIAKVVIENNIWYKKGSLIQANIYSTLNSTGVDTRISFSNNTLINFVGNSSNSTIAAYLVLANVNTLTMTKNIAYSNDDATAGTSNSGASFYIIANVTTVPTITIEGNIVYGLNPELANGWKWNTYGWKTNSATKVSQVGETNGIITRYSKNPFADPNGFSNGIFTPITELAGKGSNLK